jgi:hypothetical protein
MTPSVLAAAPWTVDHSPTRDDDVLPAFRQAN